MWTAVDDLLARGIAEGIFPAVSYTHLVPAHGRQPVGVHHGLPGLIDRLRLGRAGQGIHQMCIRDRL